MSALCSAASCGNCGRCTADFECESPEFECSWCGNITDDDRCWPFCDARCAADAEGESREDEPNPRERDDDDGRTYADPRDEREEREERDRE